MEVQIRSGNQRVLRTGKTTSPVSPDNSHRGDHALADTGRHWQLVREKRTYRVCEEVCLLLRATVDGPLGCAGSAVVRPFRRARG
jgi:hypothetical protein